MGEGAPHDGRRRPDAQVRRVPAGGAAGRAAAERRLAAAARDRRQGRGPRPRPVDAAGPDHRGHGRLDRAGGQLRDRRRGDPRLRGSGRRPGLDPRLRQPQRRHRLRPLRPPAGPLGARAPGVDRPAPADSGRPARPACPSRRGPPRPLPGGPRDRHGRGAGAPGHVGRRPAAGDGRARRQRRAVRPQRRVPLGVHSRRARGGPAHARHRPRLRRPGAVGDRGGAGPAGAGPGRPVGRAADRDDRLPAREPGAGCRAGRRRSTARW